MLTYSEQRFISGDTVAGIDVSAWIGITRAITGIFSYEEEAGSWISGIDHQPKLLPLKTTAISVPLADQKGLLILQPVFLPDSSAPGLSILSIFPGNQDHPNTLAVQQHYCPTTSELSVVIGRNPTSSPGVTTIKLEGVDTSLSKSAFRIDLLDSSTQAMNITALGQNNGLPLSGEKADILLAELQRILNPSSAPTEVPL